MSRSKGLGIAAALCAMTVAAQAQPVPDAFPKNRPLPKAGQADGVIPLPEQGPENGPAAPGIEAVPGAPRAGGGCAPPKLFRATVRNITPGLQAGDRRAQPRQIFRQGPLFLRSVEQPIPPNGDQQVLIVSEPDIWMVNEATGTGQHTRDPGPDFEVRMPILPLAPGVAPVFRGLEYGCEHDFVMANAPTPSGMSNWGSTRVTIHTVTAGEQSLAILMDLRRKEPVMLSYLRQGRPVFVVRYDDYAHGLPDRPQLFQPAPRIKITEGAPAGVSPPPQGPLQPAPGSRTF